MIILFCQFIDTNAIIIFAILFLSHWCDLPWDSYYHLSTRVAHPSKKYLKWHTHSKIIPFKRLKNFNGWDEFIGKIYTRTRLVIKCEKLHTIRLQLMMVQKFNEWKICMHSIRSLDSTWADRVNEVFPFCLFPFFVSYLSLKPIYSVLKYR